MAIKIFTWNKSDDYLSAVIIMASRRANEMVNLLEEDGLACLLNGADAEATQSFIEDFFCGKYPGDLNDGNYH